MSRTLARWLLSHGIAKDRRDAIIGDLEESALSDARYWKETIMAIAHEISRVELGDIAWPVGLGLAGAAMQIAILLAGINGPLVMFPYPIVMIVAGFYVRGRYPSAFASRFWAVLAAFMCMTVVFYFALYSVITPRGIGNIALAGHAWRLGFMLAIGIGAAAAIALVVRIADASPLSFAVALTALGTGALFVFGYVGWPGFLLACSSIPGVAALYVYLGRVHGFATRCWVIGGSFAASMILFTTIHYLNHRVVAQYWAPRLAILLAAGCTAAVVIARFTPTRPADLPT